MRIHMPTLMHRLKLFKMGVANYKSYDPVNETPLELASEVSSGTSGGRMGGSGRMGKAAAKTSPKAGKKSPKQRNAARRGSLSALTCQDGTEAEARAREARAWAMRRSDPRAHPTPRRRERLN